MKTTTWIVAVFAALALGVPSSAQRRKSSEDAFLRQAPAVGDVIPAVSIYDSRGNEVSTSNLRGHYTVLTFGCLT
jgi:hypothetical protein